MGAVRLFWGIGTVAGQGPRTRGGKRASSCDILLGVAYIIVTMVVKAAGLTAAQSAEPEPAVERLLLNVNACVC